MAGFLDNSIPGVYNMGKQGVDTNVSNFKLKRGSVPKTKKKGATNGPMRVEQSFNKNLSLNLIDKSGRDSSSLNFSIHNDISPHSCTFGGRKKSAKKRPESAAAGGTVKKISRSTRSAQKKSDGRKSSVDYIPKSVFNYSNLLGSQQ